MKNIKFLLIGFIQLLLISSCSEVLNKTPLDEVADDAFWQDPVLVEYYVNDVYAELILPYYLNSEGRTDNSLYANLARNGQGDLRYNYNLEEASDPKDDEWSSCYEKIRKCNRFLEMIVDANIDEERKNSMTGEIHFLRGMFYFELVRRYGGVVLLDRVVSSTEEWDFERSTQDESYDFIMDDLEAALELLPQSWDGSDLGRATQGATWALMSRIQLYRGLYADAIKSCAEVYKQGYELIDGKTPEDYRSIWWTNNLSNNEIIFEKQYKSPDVYNAMIIYHLTTYLNGVYGDRGWGGLSPTQEFVDEFEMADGSAAVKYADISSDQVVDVDASGIYEGREPRFYANIVYHGTYLFPKGDKGAQIVDRYLLDSPDKGDASATGYNVWKWIDYDNINYPYSGAYGADYSINWPYIRYAEIFLNDAEARVETGDVAGALEKVNVIRERVGLPNLTETDQDKLRELIRKERRIELAFEDHRFWDVRRWRIGPETQTDLHGIYFISNTEFKVDLLDRRVWHDRLYLHPIPYDEIIRTNIAQNPGF